VSGLYILDGHATVEEPDVRRWAGWFENASRHVGSTEVGDRWVSTVFLGVDHNFGIGPPILFETMVFSRDTHDEILYEFTRRYRTWDEAAVGHAMTVALLEVGSGLDRRGT
jgi:hypothetical protein